MKRVIAIAALILLSVSCISAAWSLNGKPIRYHATVTISYDGLTLSEIAELETRITYEHPKAVSIEVKPVWKMDDKAAVGNPSGRNGYDNLIPIR